MSIFDRFRRNKEVETRQFFPLVAETWGTSLFPAEKNATVDAIVSLITNTISVLPLNLYVHTRNGVVEAWNHDLARLLKDPAVEETPVLFWKTLLRSMIYTGNGYAYIHRYEGTPVSLEIVDPSLIRVERTPEGRKRFVISGDRGGVYTERDVIQFIYPDEGYGGSWGLSPVQVHKREILRNDLIAEYISIFFERGIGSRLLVELNSDDYKPGAAKTAQLVQEFSKYFNQFVLGRENFKRPIITPPGSKISLLETANNEHTKVLELYEQSNAEICRLFNVPYELLNSKESKYNSLSAKQQDFYNNAIHPLCKHIAETLEKGLLKPEERGRFVVMYDYSGLLEADYNAKVDSWIKKYHGGVCTLNELRDALAMSRVDNEVEGNTRWLPANLLPATEDNIKAILAKSKLALQESEAGVQNKSASAIENNFADHNGAMQDKLM